MAVEKVYTCDLCGQPRARADLRRFGVRSLDDRPDDVYNVDVGPCCREKPISDVLAFAGEVTSG